MCKLILAVWGSSRWGKRWIWKAVIMEECWLRRQVRLGNDVGVTMAQPRDQQTQGGVNIRRNYPLDFYLE